jgi:hypothetical protein
MLVADYGSVIYKGLLLFPMEYVHPPYRFMFTDLGRGRPGSF